MSLPQRPLRRRPFVVASSLVAVALACLLAACSGSSEESSSGGASGGEIQRGTAAPGSGDAGSGTAAATRATPAPRRSTASVSIEVWHSMSGDHDRLLADMARQFMDANPDVQVTPVFQGFYNQLKLNLQNALATGSAPAIAQVYEGWTSSFLDKGHLTPVERFIRREPDGYRAALDDFYPAWLDNNRWGDILVTLPFNKSMYLGFYNVDMFRAAGIEHYPRTEAELLDAARRLTRRDASGNITVHGYGLRSTIEPFTEFMIAFGGRYMTTNSVGEEIVLNTEASRRALALGRTLNEEKIAYVDGGFMSSPFGSESIAFFTGSSAGIPFVEKGVAGKFEWNAASMPDLSGEGKHAFLSQGTNFAIFNKVGDAEQQAAWRFLKFMMEPEQVARWSAESGYLPVRRSAVEMPILAERIAANPAYRVCVEQLERTYFEPKDAFWEEIRNEIWSELESALQGREPVGSALEKAEAKARRIIRQARAGR